MPAPSQNKRCHRVLVPDAGVPGGKEQNPPTALRALPKSRHAAAKQHLYERMLEAAL